MQKTLSRAWSLVIFVGAICLGIGLVILADGEELATDFQDLQGFRLASLPVTPLSQLSQFADKNEMVRIQVNLPSVPETTDSAGDKLAFKTAVQSREAKSNWIRHDWWWLPQKIDIQQGETVVTVDTNHKLPDLRFLDSRAKGTVQDGIIPAEVNRYITPSFKKLEPINKDRIEVFTLNAGAPVTIYGVVVLEKGHHFLRPQQQSYLGSEVGRLIISPNQTALVSELKEEAWGTVAGMAAMTLPLWILFGIFVVQKYKAMQKRQSTILDEPTSMHIESQEH